MADTKPHSPDDWRRGESAIDIPSGSEPQRQALLAGQVHRPGGLSGWEGFFATMAVDPDTGALN